MLPFPVIHPLFLIAAPVVVIVLCLVCFPKTFCSCDTSDSSDLHVFEVPRDEQQQLLLKMYQQQQRYSFINNKNQSKKEPQKGIFIEQSSPKIVVIPLSVQTDTPKDDTKGQDTKTLDKEPESESKVQETSMTDNKNSVHKE
jgi:hypothetical protein